MSKQTVDKAKVMVFGAFDGLHRGHLNFFKQARNLHQNSFLIVSIARDKNIFRIKGRLPFLSEKKRFNLIKKTGLADKVVLGGLEKHIFHITKEKPDIIALGYDQKFYTQNLKRDLKNKGILVKIVRLKPFKEKIYKNHLLNAKTDAWRSFL